jgi:hypothetical protein
MEKLAMAGLLYREPEFAERFLASARAMDEHEG